MSKTLADTIKDLFEEGGLTAGNVDTSQLAATINGLTIEELQPTKNILSMLLDAYDIVVNEHNGVFTFMERGGETQISVPASDMAAYERGFDTPRPYEISTITGTELPSEIEIIYRDDVNDYQKGAQSAHRNNFVNENMTTISLPLVLSAAEAATIGYRILSTAWLNREEITLQLPASYILLQENDILQLPNEPEFYIRIRRLVRGFNYLNKISGIVEKTIGYDFTITGETSNLSAQTITAPPEVAFFLLDIASMSSNEAIAIGFYIAAGMMQSALEWFGADVYEDVDGDGNYELLTNVQSESTIGVINGTLGDGAVGYWDRAAVLDVELYSGSLSSVTAEQVLSGKNRMLIGGEIIAFQTATFIAGQTYQLTNLLRGLRNTESAAAAHQANEMFVLLDELEFQNIELTNIGYTQNFKLVPNGVAVEDVAAESCTPQGNTMRPFSPCQIEGIRDGSNNLTINWVRRSRIPAKIFGPNGAPILETDEKYELDIYSGSNVVRTIAVTAATTTLYTAAQQTADGLTPGSPVVLKMYQMSSVVGRGNEASATI